MKSACLPPVLSPYWFIPAPSPQNWLSWVEWLPSWGFLSPTYQRARRRTAARTKTDPQIRATERKRFGGRHKRRTSIVTDNTRMHDWLCYKTIKAAVLWYSTSATSTPLPDLLNTCFSKVAMISHSLMQFLVWVDSVSDEGSSTSWKCQ